MTDRYTQSRKLTAQSAENIAGGVVSLNRKTDPPIVFVRGAGSKIYDADGKNRYVRDDVWLTDGYGHYVRHYLRAMAALPELAPDDQNHLLRTSSVIQNIRYGRDEIRYTKFDAKSVERFKLGEWTPKSVKGGQVKKLPWNAASKVLEIQANAKTVTIRR